MAIGDFICRVSAPRLRECENRAFFPEAICNNSLTNLTVHPQISNVHRGSMQSEVIAGDIKHFRRISGLHNTFDLVLHT